MYTPTSELCQTPLSIKESSKMGSKENDCIGSGNVCILLDGEGSLKSPTSNLSTPSSNIHSHSTTNGGNVIFSSMKNMPATNNLTLTSVVPCLNFQRFPLSDLTNCVRSLNCEFNSVASIEQSPSSNKRLKTQLATPLSSLSNNFTFDVHQSSSSINNVSSNKMSPLLVGKHVIMNNEICNKSSCNCHIHEAVADWTPNTQFSLQYPYQPFPTGNAPAFPNVEQFANASDNDSDDDMDDKVLSRSISNDDDYIDLADPNCICQSCGAHMWFSKRVTKWRNSSNPKFSMCCCQGKIQLPLLKEAPVYLSNLVFDKESRTSKHYMDNARAYNMVFSFTSMGGKVDNSINNGGGPYTYRMPGVNYHNIGSLLPPQGQSPKFAQLYIYDTQHEVENRVTVLRSNNERRDLKHEIVEKLRRMLDDFNVLAQAFRMARDRFQNQCVTDFKLRLIRKREKDGRTYNLPTVSEVAALIVGDVDASNDGKDIIVETQCGMLQRVDELHPSYLPMLYPLLFPYGEDGYRDNIMHSQTSILTARKKNKLTLREYFAFRIQDRDQEKSVLLHSRRLFQ